MEIEIEENSKQKIKQLKMRQIVSKLQQQGVNAKVCKRPKKMMKEIV